MHSFCLCRSLATRVRGRATAPFVRVLPTLTVFALLLAVGCAPKKAPGGAGGGPPGGMPPMPVETATITRQVVADKFEAVGTIEAAEEITVVSEIDATVIKLPFREGEPVRQGALLVQLDDAQYRASRGRAEALRDQAKGQFERVQSLVDKGASTKQQWDDASAALKVAQANLDLADDQLKKTRIVAPFSGVVGARQISPGAYLRSGTPVTTLAKLDEVKVKFSAPERYLADLQRGAVVTVSTTAFPGYPLTGTIDVIEPVLDPVTRSATVTARLRNPEMKFRSGLSADVAVVLSSRPAALAIPSEAIFVEGDLFLTYVVGDSGVVSRSSLKLGTRLPEMVEVLEGLKEGDVVVTAGHQKIYPGAKVMPIGAGGPPGGGPGGAGGPAGAGSGGAGAPAAGAPAGDSTAAPAAGGH